MVNPDIEKDLYILDGILIKGNEAKKAINELDLRSDRIRIDFLDPQNHGQWPFHHPPEGLVILLNRRNKQLKRKIIKRKLTTIRALFEASVYKQNKMGQPNFINGSSYPALMLADSSVFHYDSSRILNELKVKQIEYISYEKVVPTLLYGENSKNGLVRIWLKK